MSKEGRILCSSAPIVLKFDMNSSKDCSSLLACGGVLRKKCCNALGACSTLVGDLAFSNDTILLCSSCCWSEEAPSLFDPIGKRCAALGGDRSRPTSELHGDGEPVLTLGRILIPRQRDLLSLMKYGCTYPPRVGPVLTF
jgi:hypothetical protein